MAITLTLVQHNTDEELWLKCLETYDEYAPVQQGGPLMLFLILQRIQDRSEQTLDVLKIRVAQLDISKLKGEDVEQAARLIKSAYRVLKSSSTDSRSYGDNMTSFDALCRFTSTSASTSTSPRPLGLALARLHLMTSQVTDVR